MASDISSAALYATQETLRAHLVSTYPYAKPSMQHTQLRAFHSCRKQLVSTIMCLHAGRQCGSCSGGPPTAISASHAEQSGSAGTKSHLTHICLRCVYHMHPLCLARHLVAVDSWQIFASHALALHCCRARRGTLVAKCIRDCALRSSSTRHMSPLQMRKCRGQTLRGRGQGATGAA